MRAIAVNDNGIHGGVGPIVSAPPAPSAMPRRVPLVAFLAQAGMALTVLAIAWTADALR